MGTTGKLVIVVMGGLTLVRVVETGMSVKEGIEVRVVVRVLLRGGLLVVMFRALEVDVRGGGTIVVILVLLRVVVTITPEAVLVPLLDEEDEMELEGMMVVEGVVEGTTMVVDTTVVTEVGCALLV